MVSFTKIRLSGFKSFVDPTDLMIDKGLTGVVGPNGCGKSNLVEALRWVMGETSAKQMRGGEMDDVIFNGTTSRAARNVAEVGITIDNHDHSAPARYADEEELEITRRIERGEGSTYRINGKNVRARDVQLLFADAASGARSTALVSQGRIGAVVNARPSERRILLEEAAGITGLHSRRHEAELRLRAAEANLDRLDDILVTLDAQFQSLKKQARQASRYRNLSDHIRRAEATLLHVRWIAALDALDIGRKAMMAADTTVTERNLKATHEATGHAQAAAGLPELRQTEAAAGAELQRLVLAREALEGEERRVREAAAELERRLTQAVSDIERETARIVDADAAVAHLNEEKTAIEKTQEGETDAAEQAETRLAAASAKVTDLEKRLEDLTGRLAADDAKRNALTRQSADLEQRLRRFEERSRELARQRASLETEAPDEAQMAAADTAFTEAEGALETRRDGVMAAEEKLEDAREAAQTARTALQDRKAACAGLEAEARALADVLNAGDPGEFPALVDAVSVDPGFEAALGAALGEDLSAPVDEPAPIRWRTIVRDAPPLALPSGAVPLSDHVRAPAALEHRLNQIGVVADQATGDALTTQLVQGQRLVSREGALWRWDGFTIATGARTAAAARLEQRNRLDEVRGDIDAAQHVIEAAEAAFIEKKDAAEEAEKHERSARQSAREAEQTLTRARDGLAALKEQHARYASRRTALEENEKVLAADLDETRQRRDDAQLALAELPDAQTLREEVNVLRATLAEGRSDLAQITSTRDALQREAEQRRARLGAINAELNSWLGRKTDASAQTAALSERRQEIEAEQTRLASRPGEIAQQRNALLNAIEHAETMRKQASDNLAATEMRLSEAEKALRAAEHTLAEAREERVRAQGLVEQAKQACASIAQRIDEQLECTPAETRAIAGLAPEADLPELEATEKRVERLVRERDTMGAVNLRAEQEASELELQVEGLRVERADLMEAIEKLRRGISDLNREGRSRLLESFNNVNQHFQGLFVRLFGGGHAHLTLTEEDDPLQAGLEIMASPPGKRLQSLTLLSGGEQALTALALLFAVFMTNPAPVCVLDEVDAPLDDANVHRFCTMLEEMSASGKTRFLIITHHRITMARMNLLFGVTMSEQGVSQLVSVDLQRAEELRDSD